MAEPKPFASLSSGLLARKGAAKPAMRPQGFGQIGVTPGLEDLGWDDMGHGFPGAGFAHEPAPEHVPSSIAALTPAPRAGHHEHAHEAPQQERAEPVAPPAPAVVEQQREIEARFAEPQVPVQPQAPVQPQPASVVPARFETASVVPLAPRERPASGSSKGKTAFTLRLDAERHLKLRLACALTHRSAQQLVTEALDHFLVSMPQVDAASSAVAAGHRK